MLISDGEPHDPLQSPLRRGIGADVRLLGDHHAREDGFNPRFGGASVLTRIALAESRITTLGFNPRFGGASVLTLDGGGQLVAVLEASIPASAGHRC